jgi:hypothetical protein
MIRERDWRTYDPEFDDFTSIITDVCEELESEGATFSVGGFGQERWPVDVRTDLALLVEQLPVTIRRLKAGIPCHLGFWEQGVQRILQITYTDAEARIECQSMLGRWQPSPATITMPTSQLVEMLARVLDTFVEKMGEYRPALLMHAWIRDWLDGASEMGR